MLDFSKHRKYLSFKLQVYLSMYDFLVDTRR